MEDKKETKIDIAKIEGLKDVKAYLRQHGIKVDDKAIIEAAIKLTRQLGAGDWTFVCHFRLGGDKNNEHTRTKRSS